MARPQYQKMEHIQEVPLFARLNQRQLRRVAKATDEVSVEKGHVLAREQRGGAHELIIVVEGKLRVERAGRELATIGPGEFVGEMSLIDGKPYSATVTAATDATVLVIGGQWFKSLLEDVPGMKDRILEVLVERLRRADERLDLCS